MIDIPAGYGALDEIPFRDAHFLTGTQALERGLVALINLSVLWPRGYSLCVGYGADGSQSFYIADNHGQPTVDLGATPLIEERMRALATDDAARLGTDLTNVSGAFVTDKP